MSFLTPCAAVSAPVARYSEKVMVDKARREQIMQATQRRKRSAFREEFYRESDGKKPARARSKGRKGGSGFRRLPVWAYVAATGILFCIIAIAGSSAMIWLRKLGAIFGVYWEGDW